MKQNGQGGPVQRANPARREDISFGVRTGALRVSLHVVPAIIRPRFPWSAVPFIPIVVWD